MDGETVFAVLLGAALAVFSLVMAGYPVLRDAFFRPARRGDGDAALAEPGDDGGAHIGGVGLAAIYDSIDTLELEYQLGNLPEPEYRRQLQAYRLEAAAVIKAQVERGDGSGAEVLLEREVTALRRADSGAGDDDGAEVLRYPASAATAACPECDAPIPAAHRGACPGCGVAVGGNVGDDGDGDDSGARRS